MDPKEKALLERELAELEAVATKYAKRIIELRAKLGIVPAPASTPPPPPAPAA